MTKVHQAWVAAALLAGSSLALAGPGCDEKWAGKDDMHDEVPPKVATKADAPKATTAAAADPRKGVARTASRSDTPRLAQTTGK